MLHTFLFSFFFFFVETVVAIFSISINNHAEDRPLRSPQKLRSTDSDCRGAEKAKRDRWRSIQASERRCHVPDLVA